ncbi:winged helix-turn-helix transcriptional regulator [Nocardia asiatica]|uniref:winged helix-turn-helix transcriptional regulator n=1 Tax=Nocardia asiatica TaxID=209252 RepID=UPI003EDED8CB
MLILWPLSERPHRFGELRRQVPGITEKVLTTHLRELEADGIVHREVYDEVPPRVEYSLTPLGEQLNAALLPLEAWGRENLMASRSEPPSESAVRHRSTFGAGQR